MHGGTSNRRGGSGAAAVDGGIGAPPGREDDRNGGLSNQSDEQAPGPVLPSISNTDVLSGLSRRYEGKAADRDAATYDFIELALAAGLMTQTTLEYNVRKVSSRLYVGSGQLDEIKHTAEMQEVDLIATSAPLSPVHQRNWEKELNLPVLSRYDLIFSIFEQNAHTAEGQLQVELARLKYELPRIIRSYEQLDPLAGGIGSLGPGEQLTETVKRRHRRRIFEIEQKLGKLREQRALRRLKRERAGVFQASIVGYTNVGKSTLLNLLTGSGVLSADQYFATLDPTARSLYLGPVSKMLLTDTVGFIDDLPKELVTAFRATLDEMLGSRLLLHLADASHPRVEHQIVAVRRIVGDIGLGDVPELLVFNKSDRADGETREQLASAHPQALFISAIDGEGIDGLLGRLREYRGAISESDENETF